MVFLWLRHFCNFGDPGAFLEMFFAIIEAN
jgi:hypothetical protein